MGKRFESMKTYDQLPGNYEDVLLRIPDGSKAERLLGFRATTTLEEGLARTVEWHRARREVAEAVRA
jgi:UDP-glucose 4-epimerase